MLTGHKFPQINSIVSSLPYVAPADLIMYSAWSSSHSAALLLLQTRSRMHALARARAGERGRSVDLNESWHVVTLCNFCSPQARGIGLG